MTKKPPERPPMSAQQLEQHFAALEQQDAINAAAREAREREEAAVSSSSDLVRAELRRKENEASKDQKLNLLTRRLAATVRDEQNRCAWCHLDCELIEERWHHPEPVASCPGPPTAAEARLAAVRRGERITPDSPYYGGDLSLDTYRVRLQQQRDHEIEIIKRARPIRKPFGERD